MHYATPESKGISSESILAFVKVLEENHLNTHSLIVARGDSIVFEKYWAPFHADYLHRMYSVSKSFVSLAIGFLEQDGLIDLDDPIIKYFPKELENQTDENMRNQTIRHMLMMSTAKLGRNWFDARTDDRVAHYFSNDRTESRPSGTIFQYDSSGSFVLGALVERITGKPFMEYLREKMFRKIGVSDEARCLTCPGGHSWGDSGILCTTRDLWKVARFTLNRGKWNGEQLLNEEYLRKATSFQIFNNHTDGALANYHGYGYQFWMTQNSAYCFCGMGCQYAICCPDSDIILVINSDNQGRDDQGKDIIFRNFFQLIEKNAQSAPLPENKAAHERLLNETKDLILAVARGKFTSETAEKINGVTYDIAPNPMGLTRMQLNFTGDKGVLKYTNAQGDKELFFGLGHNEFCPFPEDGYSDEVGSVAAPGNKYQCAVSAAWVEQSKLRLQVQIIDKYFGTLDIILGFRDDLLGIFMEKTAEDFLWTYEGYATGKQVSLT